MHVEVFRRMGSVRTSILEDLDAYPPTGARPSTTPSTAKSHFVIDERDYLAIERAARAMDDYLVPDEDVDEFIRKHNSFPSAYIRMRCVLEFAETLSKESGWANLAVFTYSHDESKPTNDPLALTGEGALLGPGTGIDRVLPLDLVVVRMITFVEQKQDFTRMLSRLADTGAMIFVSQMGFANELPSQSFLGTLRDDGHNYVPVRQGILDGLFRPKLPTPYGHFG